MKIVDVTPAEYYLSRLKEVDYEIEAARIPKIFGAGACILFAALNVSSLAQLNNPDFIDIVRQVSLSLSLAYFSYHTKMIYDKDKLNHKLLEKYQNRYYQSLIGFGMDTRKTENPVIIDESSNLSRKR